MKKAKFLGSPDMYIFAIVRVTVYIRTRRDNAAKFVIVGSHNNFL